MENSESGDIIRQGQRLASDVAEISAEVKLLALNLAIVVAKIQNSPKPLTGMDEEFTELISRVNQTTDQIDDVLKAFNAQKTLIYSLPASTKIIEQRGAYDKIEASLNQAYDLSQKISRSIQELERFKRVN
ncbi:MAG: hypothetical protein R3F48_13680 [Candidatus Zixiibacteriota bacterium]